MLIEVDRKDLKRASALLDEQYTLLKLQTDRATKSVESLSSSNAWNEGAAVTFYLKWKLIKLSKPYININKELLDMRDLVAFAENQYAHAQALAYNHAGWLLK